MSVVGFLIERFAEFSERIAMVWNDRGCTYAELAGSVGHWSARLESEGVRSDDVVALCADFMPSSVALMIALIERGCTVVPMTDSVRMKRDEYLAVAEATVVFDLDGGGSMEVVRYDRTPSHPLYRKLRTAGNPGLVLFSSGSTGTSKAILHDFRALLEKYRTPRKAACTITFLLFDHIGGINTLFHTLSNGGTVVTVPDRSPETVCRAIERHHVQILPTSPTFLNLLLLSGAASRYDLSSLETVTYGTEVMPESTLERFHREYPRVNLHQTYGLSEIGILRSKSESSDSLWVKIGGEGFETRVVDGMLEIKAESAMLGYLNAPSPFTDDGWLKTGDIVEVKDGCYRFRGRRSEIINVGGEKVFPSEVENVLQQMEGVEDVVVFGAPNAITGSIVVAKVSLTNGEQLPEFRRRMIEFCSLRLPQFKIPQKVQFADGSLHGSRFKKIRMQS